MAYKSGYLLKRSKTIYKSWVERFYVLTNIGLIYMDNPNQKDIKIFPYQDFEIKKIEKPVYGHDFVFELDTPRGVKDVMLVRAKSQAEYNEWMQAFKKFQEKYNKAKQE